MGRVSEACKMAVISGFDLATAPYKLQESVFLITTDTCFGYFVIFKFNVYQKLGHSKEDRSASYGF